MRIYFLLVFVLAKTYFIGAQEKNYQSLLWEISGNNLTKKSYIYGSMHVSDKVSYHLSDDFFKHLLQADMIANESDPSTWQDLAHLYENNYEDQSESGFYKRFYQSPISKSNLKNVFFSNNYMMNNLLFRTNNFKSDYQEETYLDMFIYQTGRKFNKKNVGLEDAFESMKLITNVDFENIKPDLDKQQKLIKLLNGKSIDEAMKDYYRDKNLDLLDSLMVLSSPPDVLDAMLYKRNVIMTKSIDSLVKKGSLFAAVGAAHIPGKKGIVEMLRKKGYTVNPIFSEYTDKGKNQKKMIDQTFVKPRLTAYSSSDKLISANLFDNIQFDNKTIFSPDLSNGSFVQIKRTPLHDYLLEKDKRFNHKSLDSLFFENIQGDILSKKFTETSFYKKYDIKNKTKNGDIQRHQFFITPLEIISLSFVGKSNFVDLYENLIFDQFKLNFNTTKIQSIEPFNASFSVEMPLINSIYGDNEFNSNGKLIEIYGYNQTNDSYSIVIENQLNDFSYLEDTAYELNRIQEEYLFEVDALESKKTLKKEKDFLISEAQIRNQKSFLKTIVAGNKYYLLAAINTNEKDAFSYFNSFKLKNIKFTEDYKTYKDTAFCLAIDVPFKQNQQLFLKASTKERPLKNSKGTNYFKANEEVIWIKSKSNDKVLLQMKKFHPYFSISHIDSLKKNYQAQWTKTSSQPYFQEPLLTEDFPTDELEIIDSNFENNANYYSFYTAKSIGNIKSTWDKLLNFKEKNNEKYKIINDNFTFNESKNLHVYEGLVTKESSNQAIKFKYYINDGFTYELKTLVDKNNPQSDLLNTLDKNLKTFIKSNDKTMFVNKFDTFLKDANSEYDSIRYSALSSISYLKIEQKDFNKIKDFLNTFEFRKNERHAITSLFDKISDIKSKETIDFLKASYINNTDNANIQFAILEALANQKNISAYRIIDELMNYDLPISDNDFSIYQLFMKFSSDYNHSKILIPSLLKFLSIKDYHDAIVNFVSALNSKNLISKKHLKNYRDMLLANGKMEYKRVLAWQNSQKAGDYFEKKSLYITADLIKYLQILNQFKDYKPVKNFFEVAQNIEAKEVLMALAELQIQKNGRISSDLKDILLNNPQTLFSAYLLIPKNEREYLEISKEDLIISGITIIDDVNEETDEMTYLFDKQQQVGDKVIIFYFFKLSKNEDGLLKNPFESESKLLSLGFVLNDKNEPIFESFYSGLQKTIEDDDKLDELANEVIDESLNQFRPRAVFGKGSGRDFMNFEGMFY